MSDPKTPTALSNAIADVLSLPHSAVTVNTFESFGYLGGTDVDTYNSPYVTATLTVLYQGTALTTSDIYQSAALTTSDLSSVSDTATNDFNIVNRLQSTTYSPTLRPTQPPSSSPSSVTVLTASGISNALYVAFSDFNNYTNYYQYEAAPNLSPLYIDLSNNGFPNTPNIIYADVQTMSSSYYAPPTPEPTSHPSTRAPSSVIPPIDIKEFVMPGLGTLVACLMS